MVNPPTIFIAIIFAVIMSSIGTHAQRASAPTLKRAETTDILDANGNRAAQRIELEGQKVP
jgi:hypothetical protein